MVESAFILPGRVHDEVATMASPWRANGWVVQSAPGCWALAGASSLASLMQTSCAGTEAPPGMPSMAVDTRHRPGLGASSVAGAVEAVSAPSAAGPSALLLFPQADRPSRQATATPPMIAERMTRSPLVKNQGTTPVRLNGSRQRESQSRTTPVVRML